MANKHIQVDNIALRDIRNESQFINKKILNTLRIFDGEGFEEDETINELIEKYNC